MGLLTPQRQSTEKARKPRAVLEAEAAASTERTRQEIARAQSPLTIAKETVKGLPGAAKDVFFPSRGYTEEELALTSGVRPTLKETALAVPKVAAEITTGLGGLLARVPGVRTVLEKAAMTKTGGKLADLGAKQEEFAQPKTAGEAKAMRAADIASFVPAGFAKNLGRSIGVIAKTDDVAKIERELVGAGIPKETAKTLAPELKTVTSEAEVSGRITTALRGAQGATEAPKAGLLAKAQETKAASGVPAEDVARGNELFAKIPDNLSAKDPATAMRLGTLAKEMDDYAKTASPAWEDFATRLFTGPKAIFENGNEATTFARKATGDATLDAREAGSFFRSVFANRGKLLGEPEVTHPVSFGHSLAKKLDPEVELARAEKLRLQTEEAKTFGRTLQQQKKLEAQARIRQEVATPKVSTVDRLIAENKIRVRSKDGRDVYDYKTKLGWKQAPNESVAVARATAEPKPKAVKEKAPEDIPRELEEEAIRLELKNTTLADNPARLLARYAAKTGEEVGTLREVTGGKPGIFARKGDDIATELGFADSETARMAYADYAAELSQYRIDKKIFEKQLKEYRAAKAQAKKPAPAPKEPAVKKALRAEITQIAGTGEARTLERALQAQVGEVTAGLSRGGVEPLGTIIQKVQTPVNVKVNMLDYIRTPEKVLEKIGLAKEAQVVREGYDAYLKELPDNIDKITEWSKRVPKESNQRIFRYLDGQAIDLTKDELAVATEIKTWLAQWADRLKLPKDNRIADYITHIFDDQLIQKEFDEDLAKIIADKIPGTTYDPFLEKRLGAKGYIEDTWAALDAYTKRATRKVHMDPALEVLEEASRSLEKSQWDYIKSYVDRVNMRPTDIDNLLDNGVKQMIGYRLGQRPTLAVTRTLRQVTYRGMLGLNVGSALRNLSQGANTYAKLGEKYTAIGYTKLLSPANHAELTREGILQAGFIEDRAISATKKAIEKADKALWSFFDTAERINRGAAYFGAKAKALAEGKSELEAIAYGKKIVRETQFLFGSIDTPLVLSSDIAKTLGQFQTYTTKQIEFLSEMAKNKEYAGLVRYSLAGLAFVYTIGQAFGMEPRELIPTYRLGTPPSLKLPVETIKALLDSPDKYGNERSLKEKISDITETLWGVVPGGIQLKKTLGGMTAVEEGGVYTKGGTLQYEQGEGGIEKAQTLVFGKYASERAKQYFNKGMTAAEQLDAELAKLSPEEARARFAALKKDNPSLAEGVAKAARDRKLGVTEDEKKIRALKVANGDRAYAIDELIMDRPEAERKAYYAELKEKRLITDDVAKQLKKIRAGEIVGRGPKRSLFQKIREALAPKVAEAAAYKAEDLGLVSVPAKWSYAMTDVYDRYPDLPQGIIETVLMMESTMGKDTRNKRVDFGEYGYLGGHTKTGAFKSLLDMAARDPRLEKKIKVLEREGERYRVTNIKNLGDEYAAIQAIGSVLAYLMRDEKNKDLPLEELYFKRYVTAKDSDKPEKRAMFKKALAFYSGQ